MKKLNNYGQFVEYNQSPPIDQYFSWKSEWILDDEEKNPNTHKPNLICDCGNNKFKVEWWDYPYTGGLCRIYCTECNNELKLIDAYA